MFTFCFLTVYYCVAWRAFIRSVCRAQSPGKERGSAGTTAVWKVYLSAQATKVDVLALVTLHGNNSDAAYWDAQVPQP
jgi:hypothetical protein